MTAPRTLLITGVSRRIGAHLAAHALKRGDRVIGTYRQPSNELSALCAQGLIALPLDLTQAVEIPPFLDAVLTHTDRLDAIVHNASGWPSDDECIAQPERIAALYQLHVTTPVVLTQQLQARLPATVTAAGRPSRRVIFITDTQTRTGSPQHVHYLASKAAAESAMRSLAIALAPHTQVNAIAPGLILFRPNDSAALRAERLRQNLLPFEPGAAVIAQTLDYLLDCPAVTGSILPVDGGVHFTHGIP